MEGVDMKVVRGFGLIVVVIGGLLLLLIFNPFVIVGAGERGVVMNFGAVQDIVLDEGLHSRIPIYQQIVKMDVRTQKIEAVATAASKDLQNVHTTVVLNYHVAPVSAWSVYQRLREDYADRIIAPAIQEAVKATTAQYNAEELITERPIVKDAIKVALAQRLLAYGLVVDEISITNFEFSESYSRAIEEKQVAEQQALQAKRVLEKKRVEAEQIVVTAEAQKKATILDAEGRAEALRLQKQEITAELNKYKAIEKWDGKMPMYVGSGILPFIDVDTRKSGEVS